MAKIVQMIATDPSHKHFEKDQVSELWHAVIGDADAIRTVCGIQLEGDDGASGGEEKEGRVTCLTCRRLIGEIQKIKNW